MMWKRTTSQEACSTREHLAAKMSNTTIITISFTFTYISIELRFTINAINVENQQAHQGHVEDTKHTGAERERERNDG